MKSRKLIAWIVGGIWLIGNLIVIYIFKPDVNYIPVIMLSVGSFILLTAAYIGGTVYKDLIKSKYFRSEFFNKK